jgi:hypothetical protein
MADIVRVYPIIVKQGLFRKKASKVTISDPAKEVGLFVCARQSDLTYHIEPVAQEQLTDLSWLAPEAFIASVRTEQLPLSLPFVGVAKDKAGCQWNLSLEGAMSITDGPCFLRSCAMGLVSPDVSLSCEILESWIIGRVSGRVQDEIRQAVKEHGEFDAIRRDDVLPVPWWERKLSSWLGEHGITASLVKIGWESTEAATVQAARVREEQLALLAKEQEAVQQAELREMDLKAQYEQKKTRLETDVAISGKNKEQELTQLELRHKRELLAAETEIAKARWAAEHAAKEHEVAMARLQNDLDEIQHTSGKREEAERLHKETLETLAKAAEILEKFNALDVLKLLAQEKERHQSTERLLSPEFGFTPEEITLVGYGSSDSVLLGRIREKARRDNDMVTIRKKDLQTRSIRSVRFTQGLTRDISTAQIQQLPINSSLQFQFATRRSGLVTLLNIGTSGAVYAHIPNAFVGARAAKAKAGEAHDVPGPEFLPWDKIECYREDGPGGWEHLALIVSDEPVLDHGTVLRSTPRNPLAKLSENEVERLCEKLSEFRPQSWTGAVLSFWVAE